MRLTIAYAKIKKKKKKTRNLVLINNAPHQRETLSERPIRQPLRKFLEKNITFSDFVGPKNVTFAFLLFSLNGMKQATCRPMSTVFNLYCIKTMCELSGL